VQTWPVDGWPLAAGEDDLVIELLLVAGCPKHETFAAHLRQLLDDNGVHTPVRLAEVTDDREAHRLGFLGSPRRSTTSWSPSTSKRTCRPMKAMPCPTPAGSLQTVHEGLLEVLLGDRPDRSG